MGEARTHVFSRFPPSISPPVGWNLLSWDSTPAFISYPVFSSRSDVIPSAVQHVRKAAFTHECGSREGSEGIGSEEIGSEEIVYSEAILDHGRDPISAEHI